MSATCLSEIELILMHSNMRVQGSITGDCYCVLTKCQIIIFKRASDVISWKRLPVNKAIRLDYVDNSTQFLILLGQFQYWFSHMEASLIEDWVKAINALIINYEDPESKNFKYAQVKIDSNEFSNLICHILIGKDDYLLYIYDNIVEHRFGICMHAINLKFYSLSSGVIDRHSNLNNKLKLVGNSVTFRIKFENQQLVSNWSEILSDAINFAFMGNKNDILKNIYCNESNKFCADCGYPNPEWISINLCVILCINCSGHHRSLTTSISRIQSIIIDTSVWEDTYLVEIMKIIGNENSNSFWCKNKEGYESFLRDNLLLIKDKYVEKKFIDKEFTNLSENEIKNRLQLSVATNDIFLTMKLYHSINFNLDSKFVESLLTIARNSKQNLQEKFLSVQPDLSNFNKNPIIINERIFKISYNKEKKLDDLFIVSLLCNCISIQIEESTITPITSINVCTVFYNDIELIWYDSNLGCLVLRLKSNCQFYKYSKKNVIINCQPINVYQLSFFDQLIFINQFKLDLFKLLMPNNFVQLTLNSDFYMNIDVKFNENNMKNSKCYIDKMEIIFYSPIDSTYHLQMSNEIYLKNDQKAITIKFATSQIELVMNNSDSQIIVYNYLILFLQIKNINFKLIDKMITFILSRGLKSEFIFRQAGYERNINSLYELIENSPDSFIIDPTIYNVNDVASCLKKYFRSLNEPIINNYLFDMFYDACILENFNAKLTQLELIVSCLPEINYQVLRKVIELFYLIQKFSNENKMDSTNLAIAASLSLIPSNDNNVSKSNLILKELIDNFVTLFNYLPKENEIIENYIVMPLTIKQNIIRCFHVHPFLKEFLSVKMSGKEKLNFINREIEFEMIHAPIEQNSTVRQICDKLFDKSKMELWNFQNKRLRLSNKTVKRLINDNENSENSIIYPRRISNDYESYFVFLPKRLESDKNTNKHLFTCDVRLKCETYRDYTLVIEYPNLLELFDQNVIQGLNYKYLLTDINIYRFHMNNINKVFILCGKTDIFRCRFSNAITLKDFFSFFDQLR